MTYHLHMGVLQLFVIAIGVFLIGTAWRLIAAYLMTLDSSLAKQVGAGMAFVY